MKKIPLTLIEIWGLASFIVISSECEDIRVFIISKLIAFASLGLCIIVARWMERKGIISWNKEDNEA
jgi:hypothetical protein